MSSVRRVLLTIALGAALGAGPAIAAPAMAKPHNNDNNRSAQLSALLTDGGVVAPQAGDPDGWGAVNLRVRSNGWVCYTYYIRRVDNPKITEVYLGGWGNANAPEDKRLTLGSGGIGQGCKKINKFVARAMIRWPSLYNVQTTGATVAIRGQLHATGNNDW
jgi:hypothetical protein